MKRSAHQVKQNLSAPKQVNYHIYGSVLCINYQCLISGHQVYYLDDKASAQKFGKVWGYVRVENITLSPCLNGSSLNMWMCVYVNVQHVWAQEAYAGSDGSWHCENCHGKGVLHLLHQPEGKNIQGMQNKLLWQNNMNW